MVELIDKVINNPVGLALCILICLYVLQLIDKGRVKRISKNGIDFTDDTVEQNQTERINTLEQNMTETLTIIKEQSQTIKEIELAVIRLQILSDQTNLETKLKLFDIYKSKGGNSYIDLYIKQLEQAATAPAPAKED